MEAFQVRDSLFPYGHGRSIVRVETVAFCAGLARRQFSSTSQSRDMAECMRSRREPGHIFSLSERKRLSTPCGQPPTCRVSLPALPPLPCWDKASLCSRSVGSGITERSSPDGGTVDEGQARRLTRAGAGVSILGAFLLLLGVIFRGLAGPNWRPVMAFGLAVMLCGLAFLAFSSDPAADDPQEAGHSRVQGLVRFRYGPELRSTGKRQRRCRTGRSFRIREASAEASLAETPRAWQVSSRLTEVHTTPYRVRMSQLEEPSASTCRPSPRLPFGSPEAGTLTSSTSADHSVEWKWSSIRARAP